MDEAESEIARHEEAFVHAFIQKHRRERLLFELRSRPGEFYGRFCHTADQFLMPGASDNISSLGCNTVSIAKELQRRGAPKDCLVITGSGQEIRRLSLAQGLECAMAWGGATILSCLPGELAYFQEEQVAGAPRRYILKTPPARR